MLKYNEKCKSKCLFKYLTDSIAKNVNAINCMIKMLFIKRF